MITFTRNQALRLRAVLRRHALGLRRQGTVPPLIFQPDPRGGLRVRWHHPNLAVEGYLPGESSGSRSIPLPLDALAAFEGRDESSIVLSLDADGRTVARWTDRGIPQQQVDDIASPDPEVDFPALPTALEAVSATLLEALAVASAIADAEGNTRYDLDCLQLLGNTHEVVATDGRQLLVQRPCRFPWDDDLLIARSPIFARRGLPRDRPLRLGRTGTHVVIEAAPWTLWLPIRSSARFPRIEEVIPADQATTTRFRIDPADAAFLTATLDRLPGGQEPTAPVTLDGNGRVLVRARADGGPTTELLLSRSSCEGPAVRLATNRLYLNQVATLGLSAIRINHPRAPVAAHDATRTYCWQPLDPEFALGPTDDAIQIASDAGTAPPISGRAPQHPPRSLSTMTTTNGHPPEASSADSSFTGLAGLIAEAEDLHRALGEARGRSSQLLAGLRRQRRQERLMRETLRSLRRLQLAEADV